MTHVPRQGWKLEMSVPFALVIEVTVIVYYRGRRMLLGRPIKDRTESIFVLQFE
jgi:hypothetical protein